RPRIIALHLMEAVLVQWLIQLRLVDCRLPRGHPTNLREHPGDGQSYCHGCSRLLSKAEKIVIGEVPEDTREFRLHRDCSRTWETESLDGNDYREYLLPRPAPRCASAPPTMRAASRAPAPGSHRQFIFGPSRRPAATSSESGRGPRRALRTGRA